MCFVIVSKKDSTVLISFWKLLKLLSFCLSITYVEVFGFILSRTDFPTANLIVALHYTVL